MPKERNRRDALLFLAGYVLVALFISYKKLHGLDASPLFVDTDDAMRMVNVRDLLTGQGWFDHISHRTNYPFGASIHWSRLVDLPIALLVLVFAHIAPDNAENLAAITWPLILLIFVLLGIVLLSARLAGRQSVLPAFVLPALTLPIMNEFSPGRIDHHNVLMVLTVFTAYWTIGAVRKWQEALLAGIAVATALAIAIESIPIVVATIASFALLFVFLPGSVRAVRAFGAAFAIAFALHFLIAIPVSQWNVPACDDISIVYVVAAMTSGLGLVLISFYPRPDWRSRLLLALGLGAFVLAITLISFPNCLGGPYANVDPWLKTHWLTRIKEAMPVYKLIADQPFYIVPTFVGLGLGIVTSVHAVYSSKGDDRWRWMILLGFLVLASIIAVAQIRGVRIAMVLVFPGACYLINRAREAYERTRSAKWALALMASWLGFAGLCLSFGGALLYSFIDDTPKNTSENVISSRDACLLPAAYAQLQELPSQPIMALSDLGPHILLYTDHQIVGAPYHRDTRGLLDTFHFFNEPLDEARSILDQRGISLVVLCNAMKEAEGLADKAADSFISLMDHNALPDWVHEISAPDAALQVFRIDPEP